MNEYLSDFVAGEFGGPGLVDGVGNFSLTAVTPNSFFSAVLTQLREVIIWFISSLPDISSWIRSTPVVMALVGIFFVGFCVAVFMRVYHSIL